MFGGAALLDAFSVRSEIGEMQLARCRLRDDLDNKVTACLRRNATALDCLAAPTRNLFFARLGILSEKDRLKLCHQLRCFL